MSPTTYSTGEAAKAAGITRATLQAWITKGWVKAQRVRVVNGRAVRLWTQKDIAHLREVKKHVPMGRPKKKKKA